MLASWAARSETSMAVVLSRSRPDVGLGHFDGEQPQVAGSPQQLGDHAPLLLFDLREPRTDLVFDELPGGACHLALLFAEVPAGKDLRRKRPHEKRATAND